MVGYRPLALTVMCHSRQARDRSLVISLMERWSLLMACTHLNLTAYAGKIRILITNLMSQRGGYETMATRMPKDSHRSRYRAMQPNAENDGNDWDTKIMRQ